MNDIKARGPNFVYTREYIVKTKGQEYWDKMINGLDDEVKKVWKGSLMVIGVYPFTAFKALITHLSKEGGLSQDIELAKIYEYIADKSLNKLYQMFFRFSHPAFVLKNYPKLWSRFFTSGTVEAVTAEKEHAVIKFTLDKVFLDWLRPACLGFSKKAIEMGGGMNLVLKKISDNKIDENLHEIIFDLKWLE